MQDHRSEFAGISCGTPAWKQVDGKLFARYPNTSVDSKCLCALCLCTLVDSIGVDSIGLLLIPSAYVSKLKSFQHAGSQERVFRWTSCGTPALKRVDGKLFARYPNTSVDSKCLNALWLIP